MIGKLNEQISQNPRRVAHCRVSSLVNGLQKELSQPVSY